MTKTPNWVLPQFVKEGRPDLKITTPTVIDVMMKHHRGTMDTAIQAGAHLGIWPAKLASYFDRVIAFEPTLENWRCAVAAIQAKTVMVIPAALSELPGVVSLSESTKRYSGSARVSTKPGSYFVPAMTIDDAMLSMALRVDAIVLDVEGHEANVLRGGLQTLDLCRPTVVLEDREKLGGGEVAAKILFDFGYRQVAAHEADRIFIAR